MFQKCRSTTYPSRSRSSRAATFRPLMKLLRTTRTLRRQGDVLARPRLGPSDERRPDAAAGLIGVDIDLRVEADVVAASANGAVAAELPVLEAHDAGIGRQVEILPLAPQLLLRVERQAEILDVRRGHERHDGRQVIHRRGPRHGPC